jgi:tol-pal system protein YbgF
LIVRRALCAALFALIALPVAAQSTRARLDDLDLRVGQLEETVRGQALVELSQRLDTLEAEARSLRGDLELLQRENESLRQQQRDLAADFDRRIAALESRMSAMATAAAATAAVPTLDSSAPAATDPAVSPAAMASSPITSPPVTPLPVVPAPVTPPAESAEVVYGRAFDALKAAKYPEAIAGMADFLVRFPSHPLADNAQYWLGQAHYVTRDYAKAIEAFAAVGTSSPDTSKAPDALLKKGLAESELGRTEAARATLNEVIRRYPQNDAARLAREQLARMR